MRSIVKMFMCLLLMGVTSSSFGATIIAEYNFSTTDGVTPVIPGVIGAGTSGSSLGLWNSVLGGTQYNNTQNSASTVSYETYVGEGDGYAARLTGGIRLDDLLSTNSNFTVWGRFNMKDSIKASWQAFMRQDAAGGTSARFAVFLDSNTGNGDTGALSQFTIGTGDVFDIVSYADLGGGTDTWVEVAYVFSGTGGNGLADDQATLYLNGNIVYQSALINSGMSDGPLVIGERPQTGQIFNGLLDRLVIFQGAATQAEIQALAFIRGQAHTPVPINNATGIDSTTVHSVSWYSPEQDTDGAAADDPNIVSVTYDVYWSATDPNFAGEAPASDNQAGQSFTPTPAITFDTTYYWRVDTNVVWDSNSLNGNGTFNSTIQGAPWQFTTLPETPTITAVSPAYLAVDAGTNGVFSVTGTNVISYQWYKVGSPSDVMLANGVDYSDVNTNTLTVLDVQLADEGYYYCEATNSAGSASNKTTGQGRLMTKRLTSRYPFEVINAGVTPDVVGGFDMTMNSGDAGTDLPVLTAGVPELTPDINGLSFDNSNSADPNYYAQYAQAAAGVLDYKDITISVWVYWNGGASWQRIIDFGNDTNHYVFLTPSASGGGLRFTVKNGSEEYIATSSLPTGQWTYVTATLNGDTAKLYLNGELAVSGTITHDPVAFKPTLNYIAKSQWPDPYFNGMLDELKIYNYARSSLQVAQDYVAVKGGWVCNKEGSALLTYDLDKDCHVTLSDFALLASEWLNSNRVQ